MAKLQVDIKNDVLDSIKKEAEKSGMKIYAFVQKIFEQYLISENKISDK